MNSIGRSNEEAEGGDTEALKRRLVVVIVEQRLVNATPFTKKKNHTSEFNLHLFKHFRVQRKVQGSKN